MFQPYSSRWIALSATLLLVIIQCNVCDANPNVQPPMRRLQHQHHQETKFHPSDNMYHAKPRKHHKGRKMFALVVGLSLLLVPLCSIVQLFCRWRKRNFANNWSDEDEEGFGEDQIYDQQELIALKKKKRRERREKMMGILGKLRPKKKNGSTEVGTKKKRKSKKQQKKKPTTNPNLLEGSVYNSQELVTLV